MKCKVCKRELSDPVSVAIGIGPKCRGVRYSGVYGASGGAPDENYTDHFISEPLVEGVILRRSGDVVETNVPHLVAHHSPSGYEWGYEGSGPADLALNLAEIALVRMGYKGERVKCWDGDCFDAAYQMHQELKRSIVARVTREGGVVAWSDVDGFVRAWLRDNMPSQQSLL